MQTKTGWLAPGARRHVLKMLRAVAPRADALDRRLAALLRRRPLTHGLRSLEHAIVFDGEAMGALLAITPAAASRAASLEVFFPRVERAGRDLAQIGVTPEQATEVLRRFDRFLDTVLDGGFQPAREQLQLATGFALYRGFYAARVDEVQRLESLARRAEEQERRRIGRELHDEAGQSLLLLRLELEMLEREASGRARERLAVARETVERIVDELRRIVTALSPAVLERLGLAASVRQLAARFAETCGVEARLRIRGPGERLPMEAQEVVYRVAQETLQNVAKHAQATRVNLSLDSTDKRVRLRVADNGAGFKVETASNRPTAFGLAGMRERAALLGGSLEVQSAPGKGAAVLLRLPVSATVSRNAQDSCTVS